MSQIDGKQIKAASIADAKLASTFVKANGTIPFVATQQGVTPVVSADLATKGYVDGLIQGRNFIAAVRLATTANVSLTGVQTIDGVVGASGNRILVKNNTAGAENGVWVMAAGAWSRATDYDANSEVNGGDLIPVQEGSVNADTVYELTNDGAIVVGTTALVFSYFGGLKASTLSSANKFMTASVTASDFDAACATTLTAAPARSGYVAVQVNGVGVELGDAVKTKDCYFSSDSGTTAKAITSLAAGDILYWVGSVAGYQLAATDKVSFIYIILN